MKLLKPGCIILLIFLSACNPVKYLAVPVDYNPKVSFKPDTTTILLINQFDFTGIKSATKRKIDALRAAGYASVKYAGMQLSQLPHVRIINLVDSATLSVNRDSIKTLASQYHSDYILALKNFSAGIGLTGVQSSTAYYNSSVDVDFTLYEANGIYFKRLHGHTDEPQSELPYMGLLGSLIIHPTVGGNKQSIIATAEHATQIALQDYFPFTITHNRPLYNDQLLRPMVTEIMAGHFDKAYNLAQPFLQDKGVNNLTSKAAYNLAVVYEAQGDIDLAIDMAQLSSDKNKNQYATDLLADLQAE